MENISASKYHNMPIPYRDIFIQNKIVFELEKKTKVIDELINVL
jgi:restriction endonuclease S subunit